MLDSNKKLRLLLVRGRNLLQVRELLQAPQGRREGQWRLLKSCYENWVMLLQREKDQK